jgi:hypothetical protein
LISVDYWLTQSLATTLQISLRPYLLVDYLIEVSVLRLELPQVFRAFEGKTLEVALLLGPNEALAFQPDVSFSGLKTCPNSAGH